MLRDAAVELDLHQCLGLALFGQTLQAICVDAHVAVVPVGRAAAEEPATVQPRAVLVVWPIVALIEVPIEGARRDEPVHDHGRARLLGIEVAAPMHEAALGRPRLHAVAEAVQHGAHACTVDDVGAALRRLLVEQEHVAGLRAGERHRACELQLVHEGDHVAGRREHAAPQHVEPHDGGDARDERELELGRVGKVNGRRDVVHVVVHDRARLEVEIAPRAQVAGEGVDVRLAQRRRAPAGRALARRALDLGLALEQPAARVGTVAAIAAIDVAHSTIALVGLAGSAVAGAQHGALIALGEKGLGDLALAPVLRARLAHHRAGHLGIGHDLPRLDRHAALAACGRDGGDEAAARQAAQTCSSECASSLCAYSSYAWWTFGSGCSTASCAEREARCCACAPRPRTRSSSASMRSVMSARRLAQRSEARWSRSRRFMSHVRRSAAVNVLGSHGSRTRGSPFSSSA